MSPKVQKAYCNGIVGILATHWCNTSVHTLRRSQDRAVSYFPPSKRSDEVFIHWIDGEKHSYISGATQRMNKILYVESGGVHQIGHRYSYTGSKTRWLGKSITPTRT